MLFPVCDSKACRRSNREKVWALEISSDGIAKKKNNVVEAKKRLYINEIDGFKKGHSLRSFAELYIKLAIEN